MVQLVCILSLDTKNHIINNHTLSSNDLYNITQDFSPNVVSQNAFITNKYSSDNVIPKILNVVIGEQQLSCPTNVLFFDTFEIAWTALNERSDIDNIFVLFNDNIVSGANMQYISKLYIAHITTKLTMLNDTININKNNNTFEQELKKFRKYESNKNNYDGVINDDNIVTNSSFNNTTINVTTISYKMKKYIKYNNDELQYLNIMSDILRNGNYRQTRNAKTYSLFSKYMTFDLKNNSFPLLTTKKMFLRGIFEELIFFLNGSTNTKILEEKNVNIWKGNTSTEFLQANNLNYNEGDMGPMYGYQLMHYNAEYNGCDADYTNCGINQLNNVIHLLKTDKFSRRIMMTTYNPIQAEQGVLYPCHGIVIQFGIENDNELCCHMYQRSADWVLGVPFNIASYALLTIIICKLVNNDISDDSMKLIPGKITMSFGDVHIYDEHVMTSYEQSRREPYLFPTLKINKQITNVNDLTFNDLIIENYQCHPALKAKMIA